MIWRAVLGIKMSSFGNGVVVPPENQGNLMALSEEWWCPYLQDQNSTIETAFSLKRDNAEIEIIDRGTYTIIFNGDQAFASQRDSTREKIG